MGSSVDGVLRCHFCALLGCLLNDRELSPSGSPAFPAACPCPSAMTNFQQGPCTVLAWCWQQKSSVSLCPAQNCWLIDISWVNKG